MGVVPINLMNRLNGTMSATFHVGSDFLTFDFLTDSPKHFDTIITGLPIVYLRGHR